MVLELPGYAKYRTVEADEHMIRTKVILLSNYALPCSSTFHLCSFATATLFLAVGISFCLVWKLSVVTSFSSCCTGQKNSLRLRSLCPFINPPFPSSASAQKGQGRLSLVAVSIAKDWHRMSNDVKKEYDCSFCCSFCI